MNTTENTGTLAYMISVMQAAERKEPIERQRRGWAAWKSCEKPLWNWADFNFRVAPKPPEPKYRPWKPEEVPTLATVRPKGKPSNRYAILCVEEERVTVAGLGSYTFQALLEYFTLNDGSPCGVKED